MQDTQVPHSVDIWDKLVHASSEYFRRKRGSLFREVLPNFTSLKICDVGGSRHFWEKQDAVNIPKDLTLVNIRDDGQARSFTGEMGQFKVVLYDGERLPFEDKSFDVATCNSVIEHVPLHLRANLVREMERISNYYFIQTPAFIFPIEPHFFCPALHWLPRSVGKHAVRYSPWRYLSKPTEEHIKDYFNEIQILTLKEFRGYSPANANLFKEMFLGLPKSYTLYGPSRSVGELAKAAA
ncbi:methyltransferase domain-containing protein [Rhizobium terrae]|uniref:methyltransferase domain-containing protein n=1 Tax=Rhizobium terrae TaxID=2171756 RepID=UPI0013C357AF|nr:methyltransferase domain-containing protein [Rhizobium terrae]